MATDRRGRSRSPDRLRIRSAGRRNSVGKRSRSWSRDIPKDTIRDGGRRQSSIDRRPRSKSRDGRIEGPVLLKRDVLQQFGRDSIDVDAIREKENQEEYQKRVTSQLAALEDDDMDRVKEESKKRRQAILEKYEKKQEKSIEEDIRDSAGLVIANASRESVEWQNSSPIHVFSPSSGDLSFGEADACRQMNGTMPSHAEDGDLDAGTTETERFEDTLCDQDDMFGKSPAGGPPLGKGGDGVVIMDRSGSTLSDNWDDAEGYYCFRIGEILNDRYVVASSHGRGVFSTVVRARDLIMKAGRMEPEEVAIKIIRSNETMYKAGQQEMVILNKFAGADPGNKRHCVRLLSSFEYRGHLCLVFEFLHMNLREILKKFGRNKGINLNAVRAYAKQLFISLKHLRTCRVLHCDIKPDNILVNESKTVLKLCDFGSAMFAGENNEISPYLVSRFYRAPEIILGLPYDHAIDIWSVGCCLYELYTGTMLFPGHTNNDMLRLHMELNGPFPKKMLKKATLAQQHFDQDFNFCRIEVNPVTKTATRRILLNKPRDGGNLLSNLVIRKVNEDAKMLASFKDLLEKIFILDPDKRLTDSRALRHPFILGK